MNILTRFLLLPALCLAAAGTALADVASTRQGLHQWPALGGKLYMVAGTVADVLRYQRTMTFYFQDKSSGDWNVVPIADGPASLSESWNHVGRGETTVRDGFVAARGNDVFLVEAALDEKRGGVDATWYRLAKDDPAYIDGPSVVLKRVARVPYPRGTSVEAVLKKEAVVPPAQRSKP
ncbi:hypothetical protein ACFFTM_09895 [Pseudoduganella plicata]|uniref:Uncharacterized protein n=1 Tax=Pseudoduganella plicata TaxID=321984 RepID=A0A4P7BCF0_9BURK|nr:hypothetical protein [Pseudoduganella plicata]QBQ35135.1 hypothetical protein E1742_02325 [Pseudoduganella plicata]GGZ05618.1 hypothetical protein GCM10007388_44190 [Pseudoduganella plicata]